MFRELFPTRDRISDMEQILERLQAQVGTEIGVSEWMEITQERVDAFADATDDHQFIHVDPERASLTPFGGTIAHGFLTLSLTVTLAGEADLDVGEPKMAINYGLDKVRFPAPVPVGSKLRARVVLQAVRNVTGGIQVNRTVTMEVEGTEKPAMVAETVTRYYY
ncbi:MAG: MaoC family dehydratase [Acidimicrobiia bacterium]